MQWTREDVEWDIEAKNKRILEEKRGIRASERDEKMCERTLESSINVLWSLWCKRNMKQHFKAVRTGK